MAILLCLWPFCSESPRREPQTYRLRPMKDHGHGKPYARLISHPDSSTTAFKEQFKSAAFYRRLVRPRGAPLRVYIYGLSHDQHQRSLKIRKFNRRRINPPNMAPCMIGRAAISNIPKKVRPRRSAQALGSVKFTDRGCL